MRETGKSYPRRESISTASSWGESDEDWQADVKPRTVYPLVVKECLGIVRECRESYEAAENTKENKQ